MAGDGSFDVMVLGAGASGLMCAMTAGERGRRVLVLDHAKRPGQKVLVAGGGRCNFTNRELGIEHYVSQNPRFCLSALRRFTPWQAIGLVDQAGIPWEEREEGQLFLAVSAAELLNHLWDRCKAAGVRIVTHSEIHRVHDSKGFTVETNQGTYTSAALVVALGGRAMPDLGASALGLDLARQFGLAVLPQRPGLSPLVLDGPDQVRMAGLSGISLPVAIHTGRKTVTGALLFTHRGLSGPAALRASNLWQPGETLTLDLLPEVDLEVRVLAWKRERPKAELKNLLAGLIPRRLVSVFVDPAVADQALGGLADKALRKTVHALKSWSPRLSGVEGYTKAEVMVGGVDTREISSKTFEAQKAPGLYFIGEVLDVTGQLGGYNLHWAWASGFCAGQVV